MAGKLEQIPIKKESIDVYIDDFSITNHIFTYNQNPIEVIGTLIKPYGLLLGVRSDYTHAPQSLENFKKDHDGFNPELMKRKKIYRDFAKAGFKIVEENNFGFPQGNQQDFLRNVSGEKVSVIACCAEKGPDKPNSWNLSTSEIYHAAAEENPDTHHAVSIGIFEPYYALFPG